MVAGGAFKHPCCNVHDNSDHNHHCSLARVGQVHIII